MDRSSLSQRFAGDGTQKWKTFVLEAHPPQKPADLLRETFPGALVEQTQDVHLHELRVNDASFIVDTINERFWSFHTSDSAVKTRKPIAAAVSSNHQLDFVWLPTSHLRALEHYGRVKFVSSDFRAGRFRGSDMVHDLSFTARGGTSQKLLDAIEGLPQYNYALNLDRIGVLASDDLLGKVEEAVSRKAIFLAQGQSFVLHQQLVADTIGRYRKLVTVAESLALGLESMGDSHNEELGWTIVGGPIELKFSEPLRDFEGFVEQLLSSRAPFRLWGLVDDFTDRYASIEAVDLHVGGRFRIETSPEMIRVHLRKGGCGNTIARLASNIQHHIDGGVSATEPSLQEQLELAPAVSFVG